MNVSPIGIKYRTNPQITFQRKPTEKEAPVCRQAMKNGLEYLGVQNLSMILHGSCFPAVGRDTFVGSPYSKGSEKVVDLLELHGFNGIQLGPNGAISKENVSPYNGRVFAQNKLFIDLEKLTTPEYASILSKETFEDLTKKTDKSAVTYSNFYEGFEISNIAITRAFRSFTSKVAQKDEAALKLNKEFEEFKKNTPWLKNDGIFNALSKVYGTENFKYWDNPIDANLPLELKKGNQEALERLAQIERRYEEKLEKNNFAQFIAKKHRGENAEFRKEKEFNYISDLLVGFSKADIWATPDAFLKDYEVGAEYGGACNCPQLWEIPVLDPNKLFNKDGSFGIAGKLLADKIEATIEDMQNVRVDHALGLVDPYIYDKNSVETYSQKLDDGKIVDVVKRETLKAGNVSHLSGIDPDKNFTKILEKIVLPTLKKHDISPETPVWEDLCSESETFKRVYNHELHLPGITQTLWKRIEGSSADNDTLVGSHDNKPASQLVKEDWVKHGYAWDRMYLAGFLMPDVAKADERNKLCDDMQKDDKLHVETKFVELFRGPKNVQISFADVFGIDKTYNLGGQVAKDNWKLRLGTDFEKKYYEDLTNPKKYTLNMPELIKRAVIAKNDMDVATSKSPEEAESKRIHNNEKVAKIVEQLDEFAEILKEKE